MRVRNYMTTIGGFTLIEMVIVMAVFTIIIAITGKSFETVLKQTSIVTKSEESNIEGAIGLEMLRRDLSQAGFGLYTDVDLPPPSFSEAEGTPASTYNDTAIGIPRAIVAGNNLTSGVLSGTDYLVIKGTTVATNKSSQKWTYINGITPGTSQVWGTNDLTTTDYVIAVRQVYKNGTLMRKLIYGPANIFSATYKALGSGYPDPFAPPSDAVQYFYYGIDETNPRAPFNRTDYFVKQVSGDVAKSCSPAAGVLYKATMNQSNGNLTYIPILDCVADMQVVLGWNTSGTNNVVDYYTNADGTTTSGSTSPTFPVNMDDPAYIRQHLKVIKVYFLAQDGGYDSKFSNTATSFVVGAPDPGASSTSQSESQALTKTVDLTAADYKHYRWKLYRVVARPSNLN